MALGQSGGQDAAGGRLPGGGGGCVSFSVV